MKYRMLIAKQATWAEALEFVAKRKAAATKAAVPVTG
jgi:hypothetical protein